MKCKACEERVKDWSGSDPVCGFETGVFSVENWNCATISKIREICYHASTCRDKLFPGIDFQQCGDQNYVTFNIHQLYDDNSFLDVLTPLALWVSWYKNRGRTEAMWLLFEDSPPRLPTEEECLAIAKACEHIFKTESKS
jgi:hypothetical protein